MNIIQEYLVLCKVTFFNYIKSIIYTFLRSFITTT